MDPWKRRSLRLESPSFVGSSRGPIDCHESHPTPPRGLHQTHEFQQTQGTQHFDTSNGRFLEAKFSVGKLAVPFFPENSGEKWWCCCLLIVYLVDDLTWDVCVLIGGPYEIITVLGSQFEMAQALVFAVQERFQNPIGSMYGRYIFTDIWLTFMVTVGKNIYTYT